MGEVCLEVVHLGHGVRDVEVVVEVRWVPGGVRLAVNVNYGLLPEVEPHNLQHSLKNMPTL